MSRLIVVFLDGVGIGEPDPAVNPFFAANLPNLHSLFGSLPDLGEPVRRPTDSGRPRVPGHTPDIPAVAFPLDANLGTEGTPQSGTGQTTLLTGQNGAELFGRHFGPWVPTALRDVVRNQSILKRALDAELRVAFANAYPTGWPGERGGRRVAGPPLAAQGAGLLTRNEVELAEHRAVASEMTNGGWKKFLGFEDLPDVTAAQAGATLATIGHDHDLTLYAHYSTDTAGHRGGMAGAVSALEKVDEFMGGLVGECFSPDRGTPEDAPSILICSDHGNIEDVRTGHTRNPALGALIGTWAHDFDPASLSALEQIPAWVMRHLSQ